jgi:hypothetical protein
MAGKYLKTSECRLKRLTSRQHTTTGPKLQKVMQYTMSGWPTKFNFELNEYHKYRGEFACCGGLLIKVDQIVVLETLRAKLLDCLQRAHNGVVATLRLTRDSFFLARYHK